MSIPGVEGCLLGRLLSAVDEMLVAALWSAEAG